jgi:hypothetical protein
METPEAAMTETSDMGHTHAVRETATPVMGAPTRRWTVVQKIAERGLVFGEEEYLHPRGI